MNPDRPLKRTPRNYHARNAEIVKLRAEGLSYTEIGRLMDLGGQRVGEILRHEHDRSQRLRWSRQRARMALGRPVALLERMALRAWFELEGGAEAFANLEGAR